MTEETLNKQSNRDTFIHVRVTADEKAAIERAARAAGMTTSEWLRALAERGTQCKS